MKSYKDVTIIEGKLSSFIGRYIATFREGIGFEKFSDETILYALLELSKFNRNFTDDERLTYIYDKCCDYNNYTEKIKISHDHYNNFIIEVENGLPF